MLSQYAEIIPSGGLSPEMARVLPEISVVPHGFPAGLLRLEGGAIRASRNFQDLQLSLPLESDIYFRIVPERGRLQTNPPDLALQSRKVYDMSCPAAYFGGKSASLFVGCPRTQVKRMLLIAIAATLICVLWIALDAGTGDVFIVYGREIRTAYQMAAWSAFVSCGWRFLIIVGVIGLNVMLAYQAVFRGGEELNRVMIAFCRLAVLLAFGLVPWTFLVRTLHQRRATNAAAMMLTETASHLCTTPDLSSELECAEYNNDSGWDAWHPSSEEFESPRGKVLWSGAVPVIYTSTEMPRTVVIPIGWTNFCAWGSEPTFAQPGQLLPFGGPGIVRFRATGGARQLAAAGGCWIVQAELELPDDNE